MLPSDFQRAQARSIQGMLILIGRQWDRMRSLDDWDKIQDRVTVLTASGQVDVARRGISYVRGTVADDPVGVASPRAFAGVAPDGRPLGSMLYSAVVHARTTYISPDEQLKSGRAWLQMLAHTSMADAGRAATQVQIAATPRAGWMRMVNPPCCQRCAVLAGKFFRYNEGFKRHPRCDCVHVPTTGGKVPQGYVSDIPTDEIHDLTDAQRQAIADGADRNQVINAYRGRLKNLDGYMWTNEGTTRRGWGSYVEREVAKIRGTVAKETATSVGRRGAVESYTVRRTGPRPTPDGIYAYARKHGLSREETVKILARTGYITGDLQHVARLAA